MHMHSRVEYHLPVSLFEDRYGGKEWQVVCTLNTPPHHSRYMVEYTVMCAIYYWRQDEEAFSVKIDGDI